MSAPFNASLYVGDLDPEVNEAFLFEVFNQVGPVASVRVCRDVHTKRSLGYAYVNFHNPVDAERAMEQLNYQPIKGRPIRTMWSQRDPALRKSGVGNVFVKNLEPTIDNKMLYDTFSRFGNILSCKVVQDDRGQSKGYAYIHFDTAEAAQEAIAKANGMTLGGKGEPLTVSAFERKNERAKSAFTNVYVKNIDESATQKDLHEFFSKAGEVTSAFLATEDTGKSRGFGFVNFKDSDSATRAIQELNDQDWKGKKLYVGRAQNKKEREAELRQQREQKRIDRLRRYQGLNLYVKNLDDSIDDNKLREAFEPFGTITSARVMKDDKTAASRGFGFVCFSTPEEAAKALDAMHNKLLGAKPIFVAMHQPKEQRKTFLEQLYNSRQPGMRGPGAVPQYPGQPGVYPAPVYYPPGAGMPPRGVAPGQFPYPPPMMRPGAWRGQPAPAVPGARPPVPGAGFPPVYGQRPRGGQGRGRGQAPQQGPPGAQQQAGRGGAPPGAYQFKPGVRNVGAPQPTDATATPAVAPSAQQQAPLGVNEPLTAQALAAAEPVQQKQILGERLYPLVVRFQPELGPKITGMLLQMDNAEILHLLESPEALQESIREALTVLHQAGYPTDGDQAEASAQATA